MKKILLLAVMAICFVGINAQNRPPLEPIDPIQPTFYDYVWNFDYNGHSHTLALTDGYRFVDYYPGPAGAPTVMGVRVNLVSDTHITYTRVINPGELFLPECALTLRAKKGSEYKEIKILFRLNK